MKYGTVQKSYEIAKLLRVMLYEESVYCMRDNDRNTRPYLQIVFYVLTFLGILLRYSQQTLTNLPFLYKILQCVRSAARITISKPCFACNDRNRTLLPGWSLVSASLTNDKSLGLLCTLGKRMVGWELSNSDRFGAFFAHQVCGIQLKIKLISMIRVRIASGRISSSLGKKRLWTAS